MSFSSTKMLRYKPFGVESDIPSSAKRPAKLAAHMQSPITNKTTAFGDYEKVPVSQLGDPLFLDSSRADLSFVMTRSRDGSSFRGVERTPMAAMESMMTLDFREKDPLQLRETRRVEDQIGFHQRESSL